MHCSISRSLVLVYETNIFVVERYLNKNEVIIPHLIAFNKRTMMVHKVIVRAGRQTKFQSQQKALLRVTIEKFPGKCYFSLSILVSSIKIQSKKL